VGYYAAAGIGVVVLRSRRGASGLHYADETATAGTLQAVALATGILFISLYRGFLGGASSLLFGGILGVTDAQVAQLGGVAASLLLLLLIIWRPLLFTSLDPVVAASRGVRTSLLNLVFLVMLAVTAAAVAQMTGALLVFALLVLPAACAQLVTTRPVRAVLTAIGFGVLTAWTALFGAYYTEYPVGFWLTSIGFGLYVLLRLCRSGLPHRLGALAQRRDSGPLRVTL
jgi:zinc/manganese transport system permease protein